MPARKRWGYVISARTVSGGLETVGHVYADAISERWGTGSPGYVMGLGEKIARIVASQLARFSGNGLRGQRGFITGYGGGPGAARASSIRRRAIQITQAYIPDSQNRLGRTGCWYARVDFRGAGHVVLASWAAAYGPDCAKAIARAISNALAQPIAVGRGELYGAHLEAPGPFNRTGTPWTSTGTRQWNPARRSSARRRNPVRTGTGMRSVWSRTSMGPGQKPKYALHGEHAYMHVFSELDGPRAVQRWSVTAFPAPGSAFGMRGWVKIGTARTVADAKRLAVKWYEAMDESLMERQAAPRDRTQNPGHAPLVWHPRRGGAEARSGYILDLFAWPTRSGGKRRFELRAFTHNEGLSFRGWHMVGEYPSLAAAKAAGQEFYEREYDRSRGRRSNPRRGGLDKRSVRTFGAGGSRVYVGCRTGHWHPRARGHKCDEPMRPLYGGKRKRAASSTRKRAASSTRKRAASSTRKRGRR